MTEKDINYVLDLLSDMQEDVDDFFKRNDDPNDVREFANIIRGRFPYWGIELDNMADEMDTYGDDNGDREYEDHYQRLKDEQERENK